MPVNTPNEEYTAHTAQWTRIRDAITGQDAVSLKASSYLRRPDSMSRSDFSQYAEAASWFPATSRTVAGLVGAVFRKEPTTDVPDPNVLDDITGTGQDVITFAKALTSEVLSMGRAGVLVDVANGTPYLARYIAESILNVRTATVDGRPVVSLIVLQENAKRPKQEDRFMTETVERFRVLELARPEGGGNPVYMVSVFERRTGRRMGEEFVLIEGPIVPVRRGKPLDYIPFFFFGPTDLSPSIEQSPILGLVDVNISHYRTSAEHENSLWYAGTPQYVVSGQWAGGESPNELQVGAMSVWLLEKDGRAEVLQGSAENVGALREALEDKERRMSVLGARLLEPQQKGGVEAAEAIALRHRGEESILASVAATVSKGMTRALKTLFWWFGGDNPKVSFELNRDFLPATMPPEGVVKLVSAWTSGGIGGKALFRQLQDGERIPAEWEFDDFTDDIEQHGPGELFMGRNLEELN
jgi:hypothetical protein